MLFCSVHPMSARPGASPKSAHLYTPHSLKRWCHTMIYISARHRYCSWSLHPVRESIRSRCVPDRLRTYFTCSGEVICNSVSVDHPSVVDSEGDTAAQSGSSFRQISATRPSRYALNLSSSSPPLQAAREDGEGYPLLLPSLSLLHACAHAFCITLHCIALHLHCACLADAPGISDKAKFTCSHGQAA